MIKYHNNAKEANLQLYKNPKDFYLFPHLFEHLHGPNLYAESGLREKYFG